MSVIKDTEKYDQLHAKLVREILVAIKDELEGSEIDHEHIYELTGKIGFAVTSVIDGNSPEYEGEHLRPFLAFSASEDQRDTWIVNEKGSYLHELVYSLFDNIFEEHEEYEDEDDDDDEYEEDEEDDLEDGDDDDYDEELDEDEEEDEDPEQDEEKPDPRHRH